MREISKLRLSKVVDPARHIGQVNDIICATTIHATCAKMSKVIQTHNSTRQYQFGKCSYPSLQLLTFTVVYKIDCVLANKGDSDNAHIDLPIIFQVRIDIG